MAKSNLYPMRGDTATILRGRQTFAHKRKDWLEHDKYLQKWPNELSDRYRGAVRSLVDFGIAGTKMPELADINSCITAEIREAIRQMYLPQLVLVPPISRQSLADTMTKSGLLNYGITVGKRRCGVVERGVTLSEPDNDVLWGKEPSKLKWEVMITEGGSEDWIIPRGFADHKDDYSDQVAALIKAYARLGLATMNGAREYLALVLHGYTKHYRCPVDTNAYTILNANDVATDKRAIVARGKDFLGSIYLQAYERETISEYLGNASGDALVRSVLRLI